MKKNCKNYVVCCQIQQTQWKSNVSLFDLLTVYGLTGNLDRTDKTVIFDRSCRYICNEFIIVWIYYAKDGKIKCMLITKGFSGNICKVIKIKGKRLIYLRLFSLAACAGVFVMLRNLKSFEHRKGNPF